MTKLRILKNHVCILIIVLTIVIASPEKMRPAFSTNNTSNVSLKIICEKSYGGPFNDQAHALLQTIDGGFALAGMTESYGVGDSDMWLVKTDREGEVEWNHTYGGFYRDQAYALLQTIDGGFALAGMTRSVSVIGSIISMWLVKTDKDGEVEWNHTYGGSNQEQAHAILQTIDGGFALAGMTESYGVGASDMWLVKTDREGEVEWNHTYGGSNQEQAYAIIQTIDGGFVLAGMTESYGAGASDMWLVKTDRDGEVEWNHTYGGSYQEQAHALLQTIDGGFALAGMTGSYGAGASDMWLVKTDKDGEVEWNHTYGGSYLEQAYALLQTIDGGFALAGMTDSHGAGSSDMWIVSTDQNGVFQWDQSFGGTDSDLAYAFIQTEEGGFALVGITMSDSVGLFDMWLIVTSISSINYPINLLFGFVIILILGILFLLILISQKRTQKAFAKQQYFHK